MAEKPSLKQHLSGLKDRQLAELIYSISTLSQDVRKEFPHRLITENAQMNKYGEIAKELDTWTNEFFCNAMLRTKLVRAVYSEELEEPRLGDKNGPFVVTIDPLDGSSNIATNNPFGTIIGIWKKDLPAKGSEQVASLYKLYGPITTLVYTTKETGKVAEFVKHRKGEIEYFLLYDNMKLPEPGSVYGIGGSPIEFDDKYNDFFRRLVFEHKLKNRYCGAFVGDFSQVLHYGGYFAYPGTPKKPQGKLRLFYEGNPMSLIIENAGGASSNGFKSVLDVTGDDIDARTPVHIGNRHIIKELEEMLR
ncbi:Fructose-1,6-bisphosphatase class 1 [Candidatus Gugararchaeum adminiculabundum]|nr:Fructose-1,6-bisphosphatase class 1 [Candidatus Gugararchaeum adminiculabundum]